jgi:hypothetical protein
MALELGLVIVGNIIVACCVCSCVFDGVQAKQ